MSRSSLSLPLRALLTASIFGPLIAAAGCEPSRKFPDNQAMDPGPPAPPTMPELEDGWTEFATGGDTICSRGTPYAFFARKGTVNKVVIDFIGGGACWNALTCGFADSIFSDSVDPVREAVQANAPQGFYDTSREDNPFKDWYHVVIPYCTGDIHWGDNVETYSADVVINHKGAVNTRAVLDWVYEGFSAPEEVFVTGCSAGAYGSAMWSPHIAEQYPDTKLVQFGDSGAGVITQAFFEDSFPSWKAEGSFPDWITGLDPNQVNVLELGMPDLYAGLINHYPEHRFSQFNTIADQTQVFFFTAMGGGDTGQWSQQMLQSLDTIEQQAPGFSSFVGDGEQHCILPFDNFFTVEADGTKLVDWIDDLVNDEKPADVRCANCTPTGQN